MVMHKKLEGPAVFDMLNKALEIARHEKRVTEERNIRILIAQMHVVKVICGTIFCQAISATLLMGISYQQHLCAHRNQTIFIFICDIRHRSIQRLKTFNDNFQCQSKK